jgi:hypothetical protein|tara:strand:+ start:285 stop:665 length:381 start_codon:yes stop_codon:yes gene_type:complete
MTDGQSLKNIISEIILKEYEETRLDKSLLNVNCLLKLAKDTHLPDTLTRIRVLPTVSVVGQESPVNRTADGATVEVYVKFLPNTSDSYKNLLNIANLIKALPGVKIVKVTRLDGKKITYKGKSIIV